MADTSAFKWEPGALHVYEYIDCIHGRELWVGLSMSDAKNEKWRELASNMDDSCHDVEDEEWVQLDDDADLTIDWAQYPDGSWGPQYPDPENGPGPTRTMKAGTWAMIEGPGRLL